jgi:hypothetical protein
LQPAVAEGPVILFICQTWSLALFRTCARRNRNNFVGQKIEGYDAAQCLLTLKAAKALQKVQLNLLQGGDSLKAYDCYRPERAVRFFLAWAKTGQDSKMQAEFYPKLAGKHGRHCHHLPDLVLPEFRGGAWRAKAVQFCSSH